MTYYEYHKQGYACSDAQSSKYVRNTGVIVTDTSTAYKKSYKKRSNLKEVLNNAEC